MDKAGGSRTLRVGLLVTISFVVLMIFLFFIGSEHQLFSRKYEYEVRLESASGLAQGNPVELSGVTIGTVKEIYLPRDPSTRTVDITISVDRKFSNRIRHDSRARLRKLGLIAADSYVDISPGSPDEPILEPGSVIPAQKATDVDALISSGEDLVDNFVQISYSLKNVLQRIDRGEGLIGELTVEPESGDRLTDTLMTTLGKTNRLLEKVEKGQGVLGRFVSDDEYARELTGSISSAAASLASVAATLDQSFSSGEGAIPTLMKDPVSRDKVVQLIDRLNTTSENLAEFTTALSEGEGILPRMLEDKEYADDTLGEFNELVTSLAEAARKLESGEGTAGRLLADPGVYESINDVLIGINESRLLRWLIRNRQQKGIEKRYETAKEGGETVDENPGEPKSKPDPPSPPEPPGGTPEASRPPDR